MNTLADVESDQLLVGNPGSLGESPEVVDHVHGETQCSALGEPLGAGIPPNRHVGDVV